MNYKYEGYFFKVRQGILSIILLIMSNNLIAQDIFYLSETIRASTSTININHSSASLAQDLKRSVVLLLGTSAGSGFLINSVNNSYDNNGERIYYLITNNHVSITLDPENTYLSFDYEMSDAMDQGSPSEHAFISKLYRVQSEVVFDDAEADITLLKITPYSATIDALLNTYALGWTFDFNDFRKLWNISHPASDHKKAFFNPSQFKNLYVPNGARTEALQHYGLVFPSQPEKGASGSPFIDIESGKCVGVYYAIGAIEDIPALSMVSALQNSWIRSNGQSGLIDYLDPDRTWIRSMTGGYHQDLLAPQSISYDFPLNGQSEQKVTTNLNVRKFFFKRYLQIPDRIDEILGSGGVKISSGGSSEKVYLTVTPKADSDYLLYGIFSDPTISSEKEFKGSGWSGSDVIPHLGAFASSNAQPLSKRSSKFKERMFSYLVNQLKTQDPPLVKTFKDIGQLPLEIKISRADNSNSDSKVRAIKIPLQMPINALELFNPDAINDFVGLSAKYRSSKGINSSELNINSITVSQGSIDQTIPTGDNGGYLNLVNPNFLVGPLNISSSSSTQNVTLTASVTKSTNISQYYYKIWIDYFPDMDQDNFFKFDDDPSVQNLELIASGTYIEDFSVNVTLPTPNKINLPSGESRKYRMRIAISNQDNVSQGGEYEFGEVEDYFVQLKSPGTPQVRIEEDSVVAINVERPREMTIFPNPSNGNMSIIYEAVRNEQLEISIYDLLEKLVFQHGFSQVNEGSQLIQLYLEGELSSGSYQVLLESASNTQSKTIIVK